MLNLDETILASLFCEHEFLCVSIFDRPDFSLIVRRKLAKSTCESQRCFDSKPNKRKKNWQLVVSTLT